MSRQALSLFSIITFVQYERDLKYKYNDLVQFIRDGHADEITKYGSYL